MNRWKLLFLIFCLFLTYEKVNASDISYEQKKEELTHIETNIDFLRKQVNKSRSSKFSLSGDIGYHFEMVREEISPLDVTNKLSIRDNGISSGINFHYEPNKKLVFNGGMWVSTGLDGNYDANTGPNDMFLNTYFSTPVGNYSMFLGGPWWIGSSSLTFSSAGYRYISAPFDRNSWDGVGSDYAWVSGFGVSEADQRAEGARGIKGLRIEGNPPLKDVWLTLFFGKQDGSGYRNFNFVTYGRVEKKFNGIKVGAQYATLLENPDNKRDYVRINTTYSILSSGDIFESLKYYVEVGHSYAYVTNYPVVQGNAAIGGLSFHFGDFSSKLREIKTVFEGYYIPSDFIGELSGVNSTYKKIPIGWGAAPNPVPEEITLFNNRYGGSLKTSFKIFDGSVQFLLGHTVNIQATTNKTSFSHGLDHYQWWMLFDQMGHWYSTETMSSNYWGDVDQGSRNKANLSTYWQGASEDLMILDREKRIRYFNIITFNIGYDLSRAFSFLKRTYCAFNTYFKSINNSPNYLPVVYNHNLLLWGSYYDFFLAWGGIRDVYFIGYFGDEVWKSNQTNPLVNQRQISYGIGFNYEFTQGAAIYIRVKRYRHYDYLRKLNNFRGIWMSTEIKTYF